jgi:O-antigen/teichoic acid export membrane protein
MGLVCSFLRVFVTKVGSAAVSFGGTVLFANLVGASALGSYFLFVTLLTVSTLIVDGGLKGAVEKRISEESDAEGILGTAVALKAVPVVLLVLLVLSLDTRINNYVGEPVAVELAVAIVLLESGTLLSQVLAGELRVGEHSLLDFARRSSWVIVGLVLVQFDFEALALVYGQISGLALITIWGLIRIDTGLALPSVTHARSLIDYGKHYFISSIGSYSYNWIDVAILGLFVTQTEVAAYEVAWRVTVIATLFGTAIETTIFPQMSQWSGNDAVHKIQELLPKATVAALAFVAPALVGGAVLSREILTYIFGTEFGIAWVVLIVLLIEKPFNAVTVVVGRSLQAVDRPALAAKAALISTVANVLLNIGLIYQFGIVGAAVATTLSYALNTVLHYRYTKQILDFRFPVRKIAWIAVAAGLMGVVVFSSKSLFGVQSLFGVVSHVALGATCYTVIIFLIPQLRSEVLTVLDRT